MNNCANQAQCVRDHSKFEVRFFDKFRRFLAFANPHGTGNIYKLHEIAPSKLWSCFKKPSLGLTRGRQLFSFERTSWSDVGLLFLDSLSKNAAAMVAERLWPCLQWIKIWPSCFDMQSEMKFTLSAKYSQI